MKNKPLLGLWVYAFQGVKGSIALILLAGMATGVSMYFVEHNLLMQLFLFVVVAGPAYVIMLRTEGSSKWKYYLIAMPIKRKHVAVSWYFNVLIASLMGLPIGGVAWAFGVVEHSFAPFAVVYGATLLMAAFLFPLTQTKLVKASEQALFFVCALAAALVAGAIYGAGYALELSDITLASSIVAISIVLFVISMLITQKMYSKVDF